MTTAASGQTDGSGLRRRDSVTDGREQRAIGRADAADPAVAVHTTMGRVAAGGLAAVYQSWGTSVGAD